MVSTESNSSDKVGDFTFDDILMESFPKKKWMPGEKRKSVRKN